MNNVSSNEATPTWMGKAIPCEPPGKPHEWKDCPIVDGLTSKPLPPKWRRCVHCGARQSVLSPLPSHALPSSDMIEVQTESTGSFPSEADVLVVTLAEKPREPDLTTHRVLNLTNTVACYYPDMTYVQLLCEAARGVVRERDASRGDRVALEKVVDHIARVTCFNVEDDCPLDEWVESLVEGAREENILLRERAIGPRTTTEKVRRAILTALVMIVGFCVVLAVTMLTVAGLLWLARTLY